MYVGYYHMSFHVFFSPFCFVDYLIKIMHFSQKRCEVLYCECAEVQFKKKPVCVCVWEKDIPKSNRWISVKLGLGESVTSLTSKIGNKC